MKIVGAAFKLGPFWFGLAFLAPLIMAIWQRAVWPVPFSLSLLAFSLITGGILGALATRRGRWI
ncbi:MAG: hypothetical protein RIS00_1164 [Pseudomonadota bacterium]|jgi:hypothetical protein